MPLYNNAATIRRALESLRAQTVGDFEAIVVDDGSRDGGPDVVAEMAREDARLRLIGPRANSGPSEARNVGIASATGEWIALLDGDDAWRPERLAHLLGSSEGADFVGDDLVVHDAGNDEEVGPCFLGFYGVTELTLEDHMSVWPRAHGDTGILKPLMRRSFLDAHGLRYDPAVRCGEDFILYTEALMQGARFRLIPQAGYVYTVTYGPRSRSVSPHTHTVADGSAMARELRRLGARYDARLTPSERDTLEIKADSLDRLTEMIDFRRAVDRRDVLGCARILSSDRRVRRRVGAALARRMLGPLVPPKRERVVAYGRR